MIRHKSNIYAEAIVALSKIPQIHRELTEGMLIIDDDIDIRVQISGNRNPTPCVSLSVYRYGHYLDNRIDIIVCTDQIEVYFLQQGDIVNTREYRNYWTGSPSIDILYEILNDTMNHFGEPQLEKPPEDTLLKMIMDMETVHTFSDKDLPRSNMYSEKYTDDTYAYRIVSLGKEAYYKLTKLYGYGIDKLLTEDEWRNIGVQQAPGWDHIYSTDRGSVMIFRRVE